MDLTCPFSATALSFLFSFYLTVPLDLNLFPPCSSLLSPRLLSRSGPVAPERGRVHLRAAQADEQQPAAERPRHHQLPDVRLRRPGAGAQGPGQRAALRGHVPQLAAQRLRHVRCFPVAEFVCVFLFSRGLHVGTRAR